MSLASSGLMPLICMSPDNNFHAADFGGVFVTVELPSILVAPVFSFLSLIKFSLLHASPSTRQMGKRTKNKVFFQDAETANDF
jgi:hypothetical protein